MTHCNAEYMRQWYLKNREKVLNQKRDYYRNGGKEVNLRYQKAHPFQVLETKRRFHERHRLEEREDAKQRYHKNKLELNERKKLKSYLNPEKTFARNMVNNREIPHKSHCEVCGSSETLERHHIDYSKPLETMTLCRSCHMRKHGKGVFEFSKSL